MTLARATKPRMDSDEAPTSTSPTPRRDDLLALLLESPSMTLQQVSLFDPSLLRTLRIADLVPPDVRRSKSEQLQRDELDRAVLALLVESASWMAFGELYAVIGGSRSKLTRALKRLLAADAIERRGTNTHTKYRASTPAKG
jgi:DNA-binding transcriptional ArsR family regulator